MALPRAAFVNYYDVLGVSQNDPNLREALIEKQAAILANQNDVDRQEKIKMILTLLDEHLSAKYNLSLVDNLNLEEKEFETFLSEDKKLLEWFFKIVAFLSSGFIEAAEIERARNEFTLAYLNRKFKTHEPAAANRKIARLLVSHLALLDDVFNLITSESEYDRLEYIWNFLKEYFADAIDFPAIVAHLRSHILEKKFKDSDDENTSLVYPSPASFELLNEIFSSSPIEHAEALNAIYKSEGFLATIKSYYMAYMQPPKVVIEKKSAAKNSKSETSQIEKLEIQTLRQCFQYLPDKGDALGLMILNNPEQLKKFGFDDKFWKNFPDAVQDRISATAKLEKDSALIHLNVKIKEYLEEINIILINYKSYKLDTKASLESKSSLFAKARVSFYSHQDGRGLFRIIELMKLFDAAANNPVRQLVLTLAVLSNADSKKLRSDIAAKVKEEDITKLLSEYMKLLHGNDFNLDMNALKAKILDPINTKSSYPPQDKKETVDFEPELESIKLFELSGTLHKAPEMKM